MQLAKKYYTIILIILSIAVTSCMQPSDKNAKAEFPLLQGPYLGQKLPGDIPEIFAPGIVSGKYLEHSGAVFTPDGNELFWTRVINEGRTPRMVLIMHMQQKNGKWTQPKLASFNQGTYNHINSISPDGKRLYFFSGEGDGWMVEKTEKGWGNARLLRLNNFDQPGRHINEVHEARSGNLYLFGPLPGDKGERGIVFSKLVDGKYRPYESPGSHINFRFVDPYPNHSPTIDPDERFIIFVSRRPGSFRREDLYISFRQPDNTWGPAINCGEKINTIGEGNSWPQLSPDGKFLFFTSTVKPYTEKDIKEKRFSYEELLQIQESYRNGWENIYWVETGFIEKLKPAH